MPLMPTEVLLDVNVVIAAISESWPARSMQGHRQWTDAYLLHLARCHGIALASLESRMSNLDAPAVPVLHVVA